MNTSERLKAERAAALRIALHTLEAEYGRGVVQRPEGEAAAGAELIPTGCLALDIALGGGVPKGRIIEIYGQESAGKTTAALQIAASAQAKSGGELLLIDAEHALSLPYARALGVNMSKAFISQPFCGEEALDVAESMLASCAVCAVVIDSAAALTAREEESESAAYPQARLLSKVVRRLSGLAARTGALLIFTNHLREKKDGKSEYTPGGSALRFAASVSLEMRGGELIYSGEEAIGRRTTITVTKNRAAPPYRRCECDLLFGKGLDNAGALLDLGVKAGVLTEKAGQYVYHNARIGRDRESARAYLNENKKVAEEISAAISAIFRPATSQSPA